MTETYPLVHERSLPSSLERLRELAYNLWWSWHEEAQGLYRQLDPLLWEDVGHKPIAFLRRVSADKLTAATERIAYTAQYNRVLRAFDSYMGEENTWFATTYPELKDQHIAYFSTEFGLHESLPLYAGGLGVLSGDHTKEASDLGLPFVGVGLLYHKGYFTQKINAEGWQEETYEDFDPDDQPIHRVPGPDGNPLRITLELGELTITSDVWKVQVGRAPLYLLDTELESSNPELTQDVPRLYGGSRLTRLLQEILLGVGGVRVLRSLGLDPQVWHINEGHCAFLTLELIRERMAEGESFEDACEQVRERVAFTTHTPVSAGFDMFDLDLVARYLAPMREEMGISQEQLLDLGRHNPGWGEHFSMAHLALRLSALHNGVSKLHGVVSRQLFHHEWPDRPVDQVPIFHITNGIHVQTWIAPEIAGLFDEYIGRDWVNYLDDPHIWEAVDAIPEEALWETHQKLKQDLIWFLSHQIQRRWEAGEITPPHLVWSGTLFGREVLTIGFARRFATYKRATLLFRDLGRLKGLVNDRERPVQFVFAGKAHPQDEGGKALIQEICRHALDPELGGRVAFLENYDIAVARYLVRGVDVWLNNPRRPREASGTSGQKASLNGIPNLSILDGWWAEGYNGRNGWAIGSGIEYDSEEEQDQRDADELYRVLEEEVIPLYYERDDEGLPRQWLSRMREAIKTAGAYFTTRRMVKEYVERLYTPILQRQAGARDATPAGD